MFVLVFLWHRAGIARGVRLFERFHKMKITGLTRKTQRNTSCIYKTSGYIYSIMVLTIYF